MRSLWKGHIRFSMVTIPIRLYNAVDSGSSISFNQLHKQDNGRVRYAKVCRDIEIKDTYSAAVTEMIQPKAAAKKKPTTKTKAA